MILWRFDFNHYLQPEEGFPFDVSYSLIV